MEPPSALRGVPSLEDLAALPPNPTQPRAWGNSPTERPGHVRRSGRSLLPRKEVIQPHLPVQLPCYDFIPVTDPTLGAYLPPKWIGPATSSVTGFHDVTGGVYKARERIHRSVLICGY